MTKSITAISTSADLIKKLLPPRHINSKKGDNGIVLVVGGSRIYHGAPILASQAALRSGSDLVYTAIPKSQITSARSLTPDLIFLPLPDDKFTTGSANRLFSILPKYPHSAAIGMGLSVAKPAALISIINNLKSINTKLILDASALVPEVLSSISYYDSIVTPHYNEFNRLFGEDIRLKKGLEERIQLVKSCAKKYSITIILKGIPDVISNGDKVAINEFHNCSMTVGGTGDVLAGLAAGLLSKMQPFDAAVCAVYLNGVAGDLSFKKFGLHVAASDLVNQISCAMLPFDRISE